MTKPGEVKIVLIGSASVGKTCILQRATSGVYDDRTLPTLGASYTLKTISYEGQTLQLQIWDTAGQECFKSVARSYFRNALGAILVYDITDEPSFDALDGWLHDLEQQANPAACKILIGNKSDRESERTVGLNQAQDFAEKHKLEYMETSALSGKNVNEVFRRLAFTIARLVAAGQIQMSPPAAKAVPFTDSAALQQPERERACC